MYQMKEGSSDEVASWAREVFEWVRLTWVKLRTLETCIHE